MFHICKGVELFVCWLDFFTCLSQTITCPLVICQGHLCSCPLSKCNSVLSAIKTFTVFPLLLTWKRGKMFVCWLDYLRCLSQTVIWQNVTASCLQLKLSHFFLCYLHEKGCKCLYVDLISSAVFFSLSFVLLSFGKMSQHHVYNLNFHFFLLLLTWKGVKMFVCWLDFYRRHLCSCHLATCHSVTSAIKTFAFFPLLLTWNGVQMFVCWLDFFGCLFFTFSITASMQPSHSDFDCYQASVVPKVIINQLPPLLFSFCECKKSYFLITPCNASLLHCFYG